MAVTRKMALFPLMSLLGVGMLNLSGCDYWPPALQSEIAVLRAELNDTLDDQHRLNQELEEMKATQASLQRLVDDKTRDNHALTDRIAALSRPAPPAKPAATAIPVAPAATPSAISKGAFASLRVEAPAQRGAQIVHLQRLLHRHRVPIRIDGLYGQDTAAAVRWFQRTHGLRPDGIVGPATYQALHRPEKTVQTAQLARQLWLQRPPVAGQDVLKIQRALRKAGYRVTLDGHFGPETDIAVMRFQRKHGIAPDGMVGPQTWNALMQRR